MKKVGSLQVIVCLTSIPPRFSLIGPTLQSLLDQSHPAAEIVLSIPLRYGRFTDWDGTLPVVPPGVTVLRSETDFGPATKLLPALRHARGRDVGMIFCDDDQIFPPGWIAAFVAAALDHPDCCIAGLGSSIPKWLGTPPRNRRMPRMERWGRGATPDLREQYAREGIRPDTVRVSGYVDLLLGYRGALVRPRFFTDSIYQVPKVLWAHDDIWFSGQLERAGVPIWADCRIPASRKRDDVDEIEPLFAAVIDGMGRGDLNKAGVEYFRRRYGIWRPPLIYRLTRVSGLLSPQIRKRLKLIYRRVVRR